MTTINRVVPFEDDVIDRLARLEVRLIAATEIHQDHESRLRSMERKQWLLAGAAAAFGPVLAKLGIHLPGIT